VREDLLRGRDEPHALLEVVAPAFELLSRVAEDAVRAIPGEGPVADARLVGELLGEERLPASRVARGGRLVEQEQVAPVVVGVARRADDEVVAAPRDDVVERKRVEIRRPDERARDRRAHSTPIAEASSRLIACSPPFERTVSGPSNGAVRSTSTGWPGMSSSSLR
jgi:hypothetical protein